MRAIEEHSVERENENSMAICCCKKRGIRKFISLSYFVMQKYSKAFPWKSSSAAACIEEENCIAIPNEWKMRSLAMNQNLPHLRDFSSLSFPFHSLLSVCRAWSSGEISFNFNSHFFLFCSFSLSNSVPNFPPQAKDFFVLLNV